MQKNIKMVCGMALCAALLLTGCGGKPPNTNALPEQLPNESSNPFEIDLSDGFDGSVGHGFIGIPTDDDGNAMPIVYEGGEMEIQYYANASGKTKEIGLFLFIDGVPQPFRVGDGEVQYLNSMTLTEDNKDERFTLHFTPITGKKGDVRNICVTSIIRPSFMPDLTTTSSYGFYHQTLPMIRKLRFEADPPAQTAPSLEGLQNVSITTEPLTQSYLDGVDNGLRAEGMEKLDNPLITELFLDEMDTKLMDSLAVKTDGMLPITYRLVGTPGARYKTTFYFNHQALASSGVTAFETTLARENILVIKADLDLSKLTERGTFYAITTLCNDDSEFPNAISQYKSRSLLLYQ